MAHDAVEDVLRIVSGHFGVSVADIRSRRRTQAVHPAGVWGMYLACMTTDATFAQIGEHFGGRDQSIVRMCARACDRAAADDEDSARLFAALKAQRKNARL